ncbi:hypothetical protein BDN70DRAFT_887492 [Pholiota conissans]|uniref:F-box domain-containing protein n=1 Tax=Pholiota conissans TaxID=109636 RepID=A0A9P5YLH1_9AGAR|nr:hypothetical protein BDN70DRAFT_887492 [Pholiota conissans]
MATLNQLAVPLELFRPIINNIEDLETLCNLCLSCDAFRAEAEHVLYRSYTSKHTDERHLLFLDTVQRNPRLAALVRSYRLEMDPLAHYSSTTLDLIGSALQNMINLKDLSVAINPAKHANAVPLDKFNFQLKRLRWIEQEEDVSNEVGDMFVQWLSTQKDLLHLDWLCRRTQLVKPPACPKLLSLRGTQKTMYALLPGRNIVRFQGVSIRGHGRDEMIDFDRVSTELANLRSLSVRNYLQYNDYIALVDRYLPSLEYLELYELYNLNATSLKIPPNVKILVFSVRPPVQYQTFYNGAIDENEAKILFERYNKLQRIDLAFLTNDQQVCHYKRLVRRGDTVQEEPELLAWEDVSFGRMELIEDVEPGATGTPIEEAEVEYGSDWNWE